MPRDTQLLTVVIPVFNEEGCLDALFDQLQTLRAGLKDEVAAEFLFIDDGSTDHSLAKLTDWAASRPFVKLIALSRNFGHQIAVTAGLDHASGDWVAIIDADLQDPPEVIVPMLHVARQGYDVVYGQRRRRKGETVIKKMTAAGFYRLLGVLSDIDIPKDTGDFRVISRRVVDVISAMREQHRFLRGMIPWVGFKSVAFLYDREQRHTGVTKYPLRKMLRFAANGIFSFSAKPLALATRLGLLAALLGAAGAIYMLCLKLFTQIPVPGVTSILVAIAFFGGVQISIIGLVGEYVARIFEESKGRPLYVIAQTQNLIASVQPVPQTLVPGSGSTLDPIRSGPPRE